MHDKRKESTLFFYLFATNAGGELEARKLARSCVVLASELMLSDAALKYTLLAVAAFFALCVREVLLLEVVLDIVVDAEEA